VGVSLLVGKERLGVMEGMGVGREIFNMGASFGPGGMWRGAKSPSLNIWEIG